MFMNLSRKFSKADKYARGWQATDFDGAVVEEEGKPTAAGASPYSYFYPEEVSVNLDDSNLSRLSSNGPRSEFRERKKAYWAVQAPNFEYFKASNLQTVHKAFVQNIHYDGTLSKDAYLEALTSIGLTDLELAERTFQLFDAKHIGQVDYREVISALDVILNGTNHRITAQDCFNMFDPSKCGYIIKNMLLEFRAEQKEANGINHMMIKVLLELFDQMQAEDNEKYVKAVTRKSKKTTKLRKTTNAWAVQLPPKHVKKIHMNFDEFHGFLSENYLLVQAFISRILMTMEAVYMRNKTAAARLAQRRQQAEAAKTKSEADNDSTKAESQASPVSTRGNSRGNLERMESMGSMLTSRSSRHMGGGDDQCPSFRNMVSARRGDMTSRSNLNDSMATARSRAGDASARSLRTARSLRGGGLLSASPSTSAQDIAT
mmetsp:Transcript_92712/g.155619  ORF Transcript_92712/g.155619 Transcript_92712/m.155619 type:complete len:431 (-) Transcript_92712:349-1641(-)